MRRFRRRPPDLQIAEGLDAGTIETVTVPGWSIVDVVDTPADEPAPVVAVGLVDPEPSH